MASSSIYILLLAAVFGANTHIDALMSKLIEPAPNIALNGTATQSSTFSDYGPGKSNDGSLANNCLKSQCSYTDKEENPWWMVDLKKPYKIMSVAITNRVLECCRERIFGAVVRIGNDPSEGGRLNPSCGVIGSVESGETISFSCLRMIGQYVSITIPGRAEHLVLCEVQVFGFASSEDDVTIPQALRTPNGAPNVAVHGVAQQSSIFNSYGEAKNAIDGSLNSNYLDIQCSSTAEQDNPWWMVDLKRNFRVYTVVVTNRGDCCPERINGAELRIGGSGEDGGTKNRMCGKISTMERGETLAFECDGMIGQYVTIVLPVKQGILSFCEVQVFGLPTDLPADYLWKEFEYEVEEYLDRKEVVEVDVENLAFRGITSQSSIYDKFGAAENAIDGSTDTKYTSSHCSHTDLEIEPWWMVDLLKVYVVTEVKILNRGDCCEERIKNAEIRIGNSSERGGKRNPRCATITSLGRGKEQEYACRMIGRYVTVTIPGKAAYLTLCEVKVYGFELAEVQSETIESDADELRKILKKSSAAPNAALSGEASQSSTDGGDPSQASDGVLSTCAQTLEESDPWWTLDLKSVHTVFRIAVTSKDSDHECLDGAQIHVGSSATDWRKNPVCGTVSSIGPGETFSFNCGGMEGQYVTIAIPDKVKHLTLCEAQVFALPTDTASEGWTGDPELQKNHHGVKNVALRGAASQSSYYNSLNDPKRSIDGSLQSNYMRRECSHTRFQKDPWWKVDLKSSYRIQSVAITNRGDCCRERINGAGIHIGDSKEDGGIHNPRCDTIFKMNYGETISYDCKGMVGQYVSIHLANKTEYLTLCEAQVFGELVDQAIVDPQPTPKYGLEFYEPPAEANLAGKSFLFPKQSNNSFVELSPNLPLTLDAFTLCMKVSLDVPKSRETILFSYRTSHNDELNLWLEKSGGLGFYMSGEGTMFPQISTKKRWQHICLTWESKYGRCELWVNGKRNGKKIYRKGHAVQSGGIAMLGQDQDSLGRDFDASQSFMGKIKNLHMWDSVLSLKALRSVFKGAEERKGNIFDWSKLTYSKRGNVEIVEEN